MVKYMLKVSASLSGVTDFQVSDSPEDPFEFQFRIQCIKCQAIHDKVISINCYEESEVNGREFSFSYRCNECKSKHKAGIKLLKNALTADNHEYVPILEIDARGMNFIEYINEGKFKCKGETSGTTFAEVFLEDGEWYDYDEKAAAEVSITDVTFDLV